MRPASKDIAGTICGNEIEKVRVWLRGERFRHESDLQVRLDIDVEVSIEDVVDDSPVVPWKTMLILRVSVGASMFETRDANELMTRVSSTKQVVASTPAA